MGALGEVAKQRRSGVKPEEIDAESPYIALEHMPKRCIALTQWSNADGLASGKFKFEQGRHLVRETATILSQGWRRSIGWGVLNRHCCCAAQVESVVWICPWSYI